MLTVSQGRASAAAPSIDKKPTFYPNGMLAGM